MRWPQTCRVSCRPTYLISTSNQTRRDARPGERKQPNRMRERAGSSTPSLSPPEQQHPPKYRPTPRVLECHKFLQWLLPSCKRVPLELAEPLRQGYCQCDLAYRDQERYQRVQRNAQRPIRQPPAVVRLEYGNDHTQAHDSEQATQHLNQPAIAELQEGGTPSPSIPFPSIFRAGPATPLPQPLLVGSSTSIPVRGPEPLLFPPPPALSIP